MKTFKEYVKLKEAIGSNFDQTFVDNPPEVHNQIVWNNIESLAKSGGTYASTAQYILPQKGTPQGYENAMRFLKSIRDLNKERPY